MQFKDNEENLQGKIEEFKDNANDLNEKFEKLSITNWFLMEKKGFKESKMICIDKKEFKDN